MSVWFETRHLTRLTYVQTVSACWVKLGFQLQPPSTENRCMLTLVHDPGVISITPRTFGAASRTTTRWPLNPSVRAAAIPPMPAKSLCQLRPINAADITYQPCSTLVRGSALPKECQNPNLPNYNHVQRHISLWYMHDEQMRISKQKMQNAKYTTQEETKK